MMSKDELLAQLHKVYRKDAWINALFNSVGIEFDDIETLLNEIYDQFFVDTATWGLDLNERDLGIVGNPEATLDDRRAVIMARYRSTSKLTLEALKSIANSWANGDIDVEFVDGKIKITFVGESGVPKDLDAFYAAIDDAKPAHLAVLYVIMYNQWRNCRKYTWNDVAGKTWTELKNEVI